MKLDSAYVLPFGVALGLGPLLPLVGHLVLPSGLFVPVTGVAYVLLMSGLICWGVRRKRRLCEGVPGVQDQPAPEE